jgi:hypothetical protein
MPFAKHEIVPDVIPVAPEDIATVNYVSGGDYSTNLMLSILATIIQLKKF